MTGSPLARSVDDLDVGGVGEQVDQRRGARREAGAGEEAGVAAEGAGLGRTPARPCRPRWRRSGRRRRAPRPWRDGSATTAVGGRRPPPPDVGRGPPWPRGRSRRRRPPSCGWPRPAGRRARAASRRMTRRRATRRRRRGRPRSGGVGGDGRRHQLGQRRRRRPGPGLEAARPPRSATGGRRRPRRSTPGSSAVPSWSATDDHHARRRGRRAGRVWGRPGPAAPPSPPRHHRDLGGAVHRPHPQQLVDRRVGDEAAVAVEGDDVVAVVDPQRRHTPSASTAAPDRSCGNAVVGEVGAGVERAGGRRSRRARYG